MKNKIFSPGLWAEGIRKLRVFGFIGLAVVLLADIAPVMASYTERRFMPNASPEVCGFTEMCSSVPFIAVVFTAVMMFILFSGFNKRAYCDFYHSLPYTRLCIFVSFIAAVMTWTVGISIISMAVSILTRLAMPWAFALSFAGFGRYCLCYLSVSMLICGASALAMSVTGTLLSNIAVTGLILVFPRFITYVASTQIVNGLPFMCGADRLSLMSPRINLFIGAVANSLGMIQYDLTYVGAIIYTFAVGIIYLAAASVLFTKRKSEIAGQSAPGRKTQAVIRIVLSTVPAVIGTCSFIDSDTVSGMIFWIIALIVYFAWEILSTLKWKNLLRAVPCFGLVIVLNVIMALGITGMSHMSASYRPEPEDVDSVRIIDTDSNYIAARTARHEITDKEIITVLADALKSNLDDYNRRTSHFSIGSYIYKDVAFREGLITRYRRIFIKNDDYKKIVSLLKENESFTKDIMKLPAPVEGSLSFGYGMTLSPESTDRILDSLQAEIYEQGFETLFTAFDPIAYVPEEYGAETASHADDFDYIWMNYETDDVERLYVGITISKYSYPKTYELIQRLSFKDAVDSGAVDDIIGALKKITEGSFGESEYEGYAEVSVYAQVFEYRYNKELNAYTEDGGKLVSPGGYGEDAVKEDAEAFLKFFEAAFGSEDAVLNKNEFARVDANICNDYTKEGFSVGFYVPIPEDYIFTANGFTAQEAVYEDRENNG